MINEKKIKSLSKGVRDYLRRSIQKELSKFDLDENYICSGNFKTFLTYHNYADKNDIIDRPYLEHLLILVA